MKRTTLYLDPDLEVLLKLEMLRQKKPMAYIVREALTQYIAREPATAPPGAGHFASGHTDTAERVDEALVTLGFGDPQPTPRRPPAARRQSRRRSGAPRERRRT